MKWITILLALAPPFLTTALAKQAIVLQPYPGESSPRTWTLQNIAGRCGTAEVIVQGISETLGNVFTADLEDATKIIIRNRSGREFVFWQNGPLLSDYNGLACISGKNDHRLLFWNNCAGSVCGDEYRFFIMDVKRLRFLAPANPDSGLCDEACAVRWLGRDFPRWLITR